MKPKGKGKAPARKWYVSGGKRYKVGSWSYVKNHRVREWAKNKEREALAGTEKKVGKAGHVYIFSLGHEGLYKVGCTYNIEKRLKALRTSSPYLKCVWSAWVMDMREAEKLLHNQFKNDRIDREIFHLSAPQIVHANTIVNKYREEKEGYEAYGLSD